MDIRVNDDTIPKKTVNMKLKRKYPQGRLGCQVANMKVEKTKKWAVRLSKFLM
jgi:hypothetical protein